MCPLSGNEWLWTQFEVPRFAKWVRKVVMFTIGFIGLCCCALIFQRYGEKQGLGQNENQASHFLLQESFQRTRVLARCSDQLNVKCAHLFVYESEPIECFEVLKRIGRVKFPHAQFKLSLPTEVRDERPTE